MKSHKAGNIEVFLGTEYPENCQSVLVFLKQENKWVMGFNSVRKGWELPGGHLEIGENIFQAAERECREEVGATLNNMVLRGYYVLPNGHKTAILSAEAKDLDFSKLEYEISEVRLFEDFPSDLTFKDGLYSFLAELIASEDYNKKSDYTISSKEKWESVWKNSNADLYGNSHIRKTVSSKKIKLLSDLGIKFSEGESILESGCGDATLVLSLADAFNIRAHGVDFSEFALEKARKNADSSGLDIDLKQADVRNTTYYDNSFDKVISLGIIEHFRSPEVALSELFRVTKPNGQIILMTPNKNSFGRYDRKIQQALGKWPFGYQTEYSPHDLKIMAERAGFMTFLSRSSKRPLFLKDKFNMQVVSIVDKAVSLIKPQQGFYSWYVGVKP